MEHLFHCHYSLVYSEPRVAVPVKVPSIVQINLFNYLTVYKKMADLYNIVILETI